MKWRRETTRKGQGRRRTLRYLDAEDRKNIYNTLREKLDYGDRDYWDDDGMFEDEDELHEWAERTEGRPTPDYEAYVNKYGDVALRDHGEWYLYRNRGDLF